MRKIAILGSTGSIGRNTLQVVRELSEPVEVVSLAAGGNVGELVRQALEFRPALISVKNASTRERFLEVFSQHSSVDGYHPEILHGPEGNLAAVTAAGVDLVVSAIVGVAGLEATFEAVRLGKRVALANKEVLVAAGDLFMDAARESGAELLPVDSEHCAAHQCLRAGRVDEVDKLILTASGGPFRQLPVSELERVTPEQALNHPTWKMGNRITIDSATLMNKGFEVIEACKLFGLPPSKVDVVVHPQSIVHALVEFNDGSVIAQLGPPDMKLPIRYAFSYPRREAGEAGRRLRWDSVRQLDFEPPDRQKFPLLGLAYRALDIGGTAGCVLNAADEIAVAAFLNSEISFPGIARVVETTMERAIAIRSRPDSIRQVLDADRQARTIAKQVVLETKAAKIQTTLP